MSVLVYGAGQLAQMLYLAGAPLGISVSAVDVGKKIVVHPVEKTPLPQSLDEAITNASCLTVEFEHVPLDLLEHAQSSGKLSPSFDAIRIGADRVKEKQLLEHLKIPNCRHRVITDIEQLDDVVGLLGERLIIKSSLDGYDGYGQWRLSSASEIPNLKDALSSLDLNAVPLVVEEMINFERELSIIGARSSKGEVDVYPLVENLHHKGQLHVTVAPATAISEALTEQARSIFSTIVNELDYVGVLAVELFQVDGQLLVNELAPRVHNSGHWTQHGAETSQFENHLRAVLGLPLGSTQSHGVSAMINVIGCGGLSKDLLAVEGSHLHWYGKSPREKRKMGHINVVADNYAELADKIDRIRVHIPEVHFPMLPDEIARLSAL